MPFRRSKSTPFISNWSKDFVEHLRTVHFSLVALSTGLIVFAISGKPYNSVVALRELHEIIELQKVWSAPWVFSHFPHEQIFRDTTGRALEVNRLLKGSVNSEVIHAKITYPGSQPPLYVDLDFPLHYSDSPYWDFPESLTEFESWWDGLRTSQTPTIVTKIKDQAIVSTATSPAAVGMELSIDPLVPEYELFDSVQPEHSFTQYDSGNRRSYDLEFVGDLPSQALHFRVRSAGASRIKLDQKLIAQRFTQWKEGSFKQAFPDLEFAARGLKDLNFEEVDKILTAEAGKNSEFFEAFGMKFPTNQLAISGTIFLLCVQFYQMIYLVQLKGRLSRSDPGWDVPWIAMVQTQEAQVVFFLSVVVLPVLALTTIEINLAIPRLVPLRTLAHQASFDLKLALLSIANLISVWLGTMTWRSRPRTVESKVELAFRRKSK
jgi:hypothetical protein